jgi:hypothetical protein
MAPNELCDVRPSSDLNSNNNRCMNDVLIRDCYILWILASVALPFDGSLRQSGNFEPSTHSKSQIPSSQMFIG